MRIGTAVDGVLVAAGLAAALLTLNLVQQSAGPGAAPSSASDVTTVAERPPVVVVAASDSPADVAVGRAVAEAAGGALLAVDATGLTAATTAQLSRWRPGRVLVLGGPAAVSERTAAALRQHASGSVTRLSGADRFATAALVARTQFPSPVRQVRILSGDAAAVPAPGRATGGADSPVLLVDRDRIPASTAAALRELRPGSVEVVGGPGAVSDGVLEQLRTLTGRPVVRLP